MNIITKNIRMLKTFYTDLWNDGLKKGEQIAKRFKRDRRMSD